MENNHSFDWHGFKFGLAATAAFVVLAANVQYGLAYFAPDTYPLPPAPIAITHISPTTAPTQPQRTIAARTIEASIPAKGKFIATDLVNMKLYLYQDGTTTAEYPILTKGKPGSPYETPSGFYNVLTKEKNHLNYGEQVNMPYSMEFYGNYFIHGWPTYTDDTPVASTFSGGCIRLSTADAKEVYAFADRGTGIFVYDTGAATTTQTLALGGIPLPTISAASYLVADMDTGDVYAEKDAHGQRPIASVTKLMTALVANETIMFDHKITVPRGKLNSVEVATDTVPEVFVIGNLLYPLLMESNNNIADTLAEYYGAHAFVSRMNSQAHALNMASTTFADASGVSIDNASTPEDLYRLAAYLTNKKSFVWGITRTPSKTIVAADGSRYTFSNFNKFSDLSTFVGGKVGHTTPAQDTMVSVFSIPINGIQRRIAVIILDSNDYTIDTKQLADWFNQSASAAVNTACAACTSPTRYRKIQL